MALDSMHEPRASGFEKDKPFAPPQEREPSLAIIILFWLCLAFLLVKLFQNRWQPPASTMTSAPAAVTAPAKK